MEPATRGAVPAPFPHRADARAVVVPLVPGLPQRQTTAQFGGVAGAGRVRENRCHPTGRSLRGSLHDFRGNPLPRDA